MLVRSKLSIYYIEKHVLAINVSFYNGSFSNLTRRLYHGKLSYANVVAMETQDNKDITQKKPPSRFSCSVNSVTLNDTKLEILILSEIKYFSANFGYHKDIVTKTIVIYENFRISVGCQGSHSAVANSPNKEFLASKRHTGYPKEKVSIKSFYSGLFTASINSFWIYLDSVYR